MRVFLGAFGDPGHAFPMLALGRALVARGHEVHLETWKRWRPRAEAAGIRFADAPEYQVFPTPSARHLKPYEAAVKAARETGAMLERIRPEVAVADIMTPAACAGRGGGRACRWRRSCRTCSRRWRRGSRSTRSARGCRARGSARALWTRAGARFVTPALELGRDQLNESRRRLGLAPLPYVHTGLSRELTLVATMPELEYPRDVAAVGAGGRAAAVGAAGGRAGRPAARRRPGRAVAPSTAQDREHRLLRAALAGLAGEPVRVIATWNGREPDPPIGGPGQRRAGAVAVVLEDDAGLRRGRLPRRPRDAGARADAAAARWSCARRLGDMAENASRVDWAGLGVRLPRRWCTPRGVRAAVRPRARRRARCGRAWRRCAGRTARARAAAELENWAR